MPPFSQIRPPFPAKPLLAALLALAATAVVLLLGASRADAYIYWATLGGFGEGDVGRVANDGSKLDRGFIKGAIGPVAVAVDDKHLYWINNDSQSIGRSRLDGSKVDQMFIKHVGFSSDLVITDDYIYWTRSSTIEEEAGIARADIDGSNVERSLVAIPDDSSAGLAEIAIDDEFIYWTHFYKHDWISRARLDGSDYEPKFLTEGVRTPYGIAVTDEYLLWGNGRGKDIGRAAINGADPDPLFLEDVGRAVSIEVDDRYLYWPGGSTGQRGKILRAKVAGGGRVKAIVKGGADGGSIALDDRGPRPSR